MTQFYYIIYIYYILLHVNIRIAVITKLYGYSLLCVFTFYFAIEDKTSEHYFEFQSKRERAIALYCVQST